MSLGTAFRAFFAALGHSERAEAIRKILDGETTARLESADPDAASQARPPGAKADEQRLAAISLVATLQREARLIDLVQEPLDQFSDAQVGAAARPCLKQCQQTLDRIFALQPLVAESEGASIEVPEDASPLRYQWLGGTRGQRGQLVHPGWIATQCELAKWTGDQADAKVVAPAQIQG